jgi:hypothetical protein
MKSKIAVTCGLVCSVLLSGCGGDGDSDFSSITGTLVDPYISGAVLCQDTNGNKQCDDGEPTSSTSSENGVFTFLSPLTMGKNIIIKTQGIHKGKTYDLNISGVVAGDGTISVVSLLTTFESKGLDSTQIVAILTKAKTDAITNDGATNLESFDLNSSTILLDPISGKKSFFNYRCRIIKSASIT